jgi:hypothetical protein
VGDEGDDGRNSGSPRLSESPPNLEDPDPVGVELSGPAETEGDSANDDDVQEVQASESQERPRLSLSIPPSPPSATVLPTAIVHGTVDVLVPLASKKEVDLIATLEQHIRTEQTSLVSRARPLATSHGLLHTCEVGDRWGPLRDVRKAAARQAEFDSWGAGPDGEF